MYSQPDRCHGRQFPAFAWSTCGRCLRSCLGIIFGSLTAFCQLTTVGAAQASSATDDQLFETRVRPVLLDTCVRCHGGDKVSGGLRVDSRAALLQGGDSGPAIMPGAAEASLLLQALRHADNVSAMPPDRRLDKATVDAFEAWIAAGAPWPANAPAVQSRRHWAFEPVQEVQPPPVTPLTAADATPIDRFLDAALQQAGLQPLPAADRRTLIRRASYALTGLPPSAEEVDAFVADPAADAWDRLIDRLLKSPHYGEHWGRHWLDIVRYADTAGENSDHPLPHAWRYRNWVIAAFNANQPYDQFITEQLAGDILAESLIREQPTAGAKYADLIVATGYLAIARRFGHDIDKDMHLTYEDVIDTLGKSVLGLTLGCARCHSHKYDPISAADYYALYGIFDSTRFAFPGCEPQPLPRDLVPLVPPHEQARIEQEYLAPVAALDAQLRGLQEQITAGQLPDSALQGQRTVLNSGVIMDAGQQLLTQTTAAAEPEQPDTIHVRRGQLLLLSISPQSSYGADSTLVELEITRTDTPSTDGDSTPHLWQLTADVVDSFLEGNPHHDRQGQAAVWCFLDCRGGLRLLPEQVRNLQDKPGLHVWRNGDNPAVFVNSTAEPIDVWTQLPAKTVFVHPAQDGPVGIGWLCPQDGTFRVRGRIADAHPGGDGVGWQLELIRSDLSGQWQKVGAQLAEAARLRQARDARAAQIPPRPVAYAVVEGQPHNVRLQLRGDPEQAGDEVPRRWLELFGGQPVPADSGSGRLQLAQWLTSPQNPLTARVMVNRLWQYHFGEGLVRTPNDFGTRGQPPTHPELLDWLAAEFVRSGWDIQHMQRLILRSQAWQRSSTEPAPAEAATAEATVAGARTDSVQDADNRLLSRFTRRRLSAEEIRDTLLAVSGQLDLSPGGPHPFPAEETWRFTQHNPFQDIYDTRRRSVYLMVLRNRRHPFLGLFDGADPNASTPQRQSTTVPTQALYFMNDAFVHQCGDALSQSLLPLTDDQQRLQQLYRLCLQRLPQPTEVTALQQFLQTYRTAAGEDSAAARDAAAWAACCRLLLASNEFLFVD